MCVCVCVHACVCVYTHMKYIYMYCVCIYILFSHEKEGHPAICENMDGVTIFFLFFKKF